MPLFVGKDLEREQHLMTEVIREVIREVLREALREVFREVIREVIREALREVVRKVLRVVIRGQQLWNAVDASPCAQAPSGPSPGATDSRRGGCTWTR